MTATPTTSSVRRHLLLLVLALMLGNLVRPAYARTQDVTGTRSSLTDPANDDVSNTVTNAVVLVGGGCSGTLIAPTIVITSAHCIPGPVGGEWAGWLDQRAVWRPFAFPAFTVNDCCVSALRGQLSQANRDLPGWDISSMPLTQAEPAVCRAACDSNGSCQAWTYVRPGRQGPSARCYLKRAGVAIAFGNDRRSPIYRAFGSQYSMPGANDIAMVRLDAAVPNTIAQPSRVLTQLRRGQAPRTWLRAHSYAFSGWGGGRPIRRTAAAAFAEYPFVSFGVLELNMMRMTGSGGVSLEGGDSGSPAFMNTPACRPDLAVTQRYVTGVAQGIQASGGRFVSTFSEGGFDASGRRQPNLGRWIASTVYRNETIINAIDVTIVTGDDDLRGGAVAYGIIGLTGGRTLPRVNLNGGNGWGGNSTNTITLNLPLGTRLGDLASFGIDHDGTPRNFGETYDNWNVNAVNLAFRPGPQCPANLGSRAGTPLMRFTGERRTWGTILAVP